MIIAVNTISHDSRHPSRIVLPLMPIRYLLYPRFPQYAGWSDFCFMLVFYISGHMLIADERYEAAGVFDVNGWGRKYIGLADFPNCTPPDLTVMCFDDMGGWTADNVKDVYIRPDGAELDFTSSQHGICGIFPIG